MRRLWMEASGMAGSPFAFSYRSTFDAVCAAQLKEGLTALRARLAAVMLSKTVAPIVVLIPVPTLPATSFENAATSIYPRRRVQSAANPADAGRFNCGHPTDSFRRRGILRAPVHRTFGGVLAAATCQVRGRRASPAGGSMTKVEASREICGL